MDDTKAWQKQCLEAFQDWWRCTTDEEWTGMFAEHATAWRAFQAGWRAAKEIRP